MNNFKIGKFIVLGNISLKSLKTDKGLYHYTDTGLTIYELNSPIPIIRNGECLGLATPIQFTAYENVTKVYFEFTKLPEESLRVFEKLYINSKNMSSSEIDRYDDTSAIAGFYPTPQENLADNIHRGKYRKKSKKSEHGIFDSLYDKDDDFDYDNY